jgi:putative toxin-antitoxin system antitoxin component (TIGR02293 family)
MKTIHELLGVKETSLNYRTSDLDLANAVLQGLPPQFADRIKERFGLSSREMDEIINRRTRGRRKENNELLTVEESDRLVRVARLFALAEETLGGLEKAGHWMRHANVALGNAQPIAFITTDTGARIVEQVLGRLAHGVYS